MNGNQWMHLIGYIQLGYPGHVLCTFSRNVGGFIHLKDGFTFYNYTQVTHDEF